MSAVLVVLVVVWAAIGTFLALLPDAPGSIFGGDFGHITVAAVLAFGLAVRFPVLRRRFGAVLLAGGALLGLAIELAQAASGGSRSFELADLIGDVAGIGLGLIAASFVGRQVAGQKAHGLTAAVLGVASCFAIVGPVRASAPVDRWTDCASGRNDVDDVIRTLASNDPDASFERAGVPRATEHGRSRTTDRQATDLVKEIRCRDAFTVTARVRPANIDQTGPSRIVSIAEGTRFFEQNMIVGIVESDLVVRVRVRPDRFETFTAPDVFTPGAEHAVVVSFGDGVLTVMIDGSERLREKADRSTFVNWSTNFPLNVGNELTDDRIFAGDISDVRVEARTNRTG
jgi:hypothetical protein